MRSTMKWNANSFMATEMAKLFGAKTFDRIIAYRRESFGQTKLGEINPSRTGDLDETDKALKFIMDITKEQSNSYDVFFRFIKE